MTDDQKTTQLTINLDTTGKIQVIGALLASSILLMASGYLIGDSNGMDKQHFQEVMDNSTIDTLEMANQSFSEGNTETGVNHTESAMTMIWANLQVTGDEKYKTMWGRLGFQCVKDAQEQPCQSVVQESIEVLKGLETQEPSQASQPA